MKIDVSIVKEFLENIVHLNNCIADTIKNGDDGFEDSAIEITQEIKNHIDTFNALNLTALTKINEDTRHEYLKHYEKYAYDPTNANEKKMYKAKLYLHIKKHIRDNVSAEVLSSISNDDLSNYIEVEAIHNSQFSAAFNSNEFFMSTILVLEDVVNEIKEERLKNPQQKLFE